MGTVGAGETGCIFVRGWVAIGHLLLKSIARMYFFNGLCNTASAV